jgi:flagellar protein FliJ
VTDVPFRFGLERVRELRAHDEDRAREQFAASLSARMRGAAMLQSAQDLVERARDARREFADAPLSGQDLMHRQLWLERVERGRQSAELDLTRHDAEVDARRRALAAARQQREVLERLKDRRRAEHDRENERRAGAVLDEMAISAHRRRGAR